MTDKITIALFGAGGKMGCRIIDHLKDNPAYKLLCIENGSRGLLKLQERGLSPVSQDEALPRANVVILALPDRVLGSVAREIVPKLKTGTMVFTLDPAAAYAGEFPERPDITYFVSHPCHPSVFEHFKTELEINDFFGGIQARQAIVCALMQGPEEYYALGDRIARDIYAPVTRSHRITVEQMAILEPAMAETVAICLVMTLRDALEEAVKRGVPREAAEDFLFGHIKVELGIAFGRVDFPFSDGAKLIARFGHEHLLKPDWRTLFSSESLKQQVRAIVSGELPSA